jgi:hypothetical protein
MAEGQFRLRIRYAKLSRLRYLSHLEVIRAAMRIIRRADLPYAVSQGFSPHMKAAFSSALPVGCAGLDEYVDVWLTRYVPVKEALTALISSAPESMPVLDCAYLDDEALALTAAYPLATYRALVDISALGAVSAEATACTDTVCEQAITPCLPSDEPRAIDPLEACSLVQDSIDHLLAIGVIEVERKGKVKRLDLTKLIAKAPLAMVPHVRGKALRDTGEVLDDGAPAPTESLVEMCFTTAASNEGSLRADVLLGAIAADAHTELPVRWLCHERQTCLTKEGTEERPL